MFSKFSSGECAEGLFSIASRSFGQLQQIFAFPHRVYLQAGSNSLLWRRVLLGGRCRWYQDVFLFAGFCELSDVGVKELQVMFEMFCGVQYRYGERNFVFSESLTFSPCQSVRRGLWHVFEAI